MSHPETERLVAQASELVKQGRFPEAKALCEQISRNDAQNAEVWNTLGAINGRLGNLEQAERCCREALRIQPDFPGACMNLGNVLEQQGRLQEAIANYRKAVELRPAFPQAWYMMGNILARLGNLAESESACRETIRLAPDFSEAHFILANVLHAQHKIAESMAAYQQSLRINPANDEAHARLGLLLQAQGRYADAKACHEHALDLNPGQPLVLLNLAICLQDLKQFREAEERYRQALVFKPDFVEAISRLAYLCERTQQSEEAGNLVRRGLAISPESPSLLLTQAKLEQREGHLEESLRLLERVLQLNIEPELLGEIHSRIGSLYDRLGDYDRAFSSFSKGNQIAAGKFQKHGINRNDYLQKLDSLFGLLTSNLPDSLPEQMGQERGLTPVFLIGFPRSGTTLLDQILDSHPRLQTLEEKPAAFAMEQEFGKLTEGREDALASLTEEELLQLRKTYFSIIDKFIERRPDSILIDKFPLNITTAHLIWRVFPHAKFILALRHPCDVCLSCFMQSFGMNTAMANFLTLGDTVNLYARIMGFWQQCTRTLPLQYHSIKYEGIVADMESETRMLLDFLEVDWDNAILRHSDHARKRGVIDTPSYHQVSQPIYQHARYRWKHYADRFEPFMETLLPFIESFGYSGE